ncbi:MAG: DNA polymerase III subunit delta [Bacteroidales bacterium]|jgi:DNA polymerase-3 subunit delta|nr:DNA polymerase III subunit delta [Bacteroidales bacterium]
MTYNEILNDLKNKIYKPVYLLYGEESYFIDKITDYISENVLTEAEKAFNQVVIYGKDTDVTSVIQAARRFPMMSNHQVVIVKEAQHLKPLSELDVYFENPLKSTILVLAIKETQKLDKRTKAIKLAEKIGAVLESKKPYENEMIKWVSTLANSYGLTLTPGAQRLMYEYIGADLSRLDSEMKKLKTASADKSQVNEEDVSKNIGINREFNIFELQKAIGTKKALAAYQITDYFAKNPKSTYIGLAIKQIYDYFTRILKLHYATDKSKNGLAAAIGVNPFFVDEYKTAASYYPVAKILRIVSFLREADIKSKGMGGTYTDGDIYKELIYKIMHV